MEPLLFPKQELEYQTKRVLHLAKRFIEGTKCRNCGEKERKASALYEFGDPYLPSQVLIFCPKCHRNDVFALRPAEEAMALAKMEQKKEQTEVVGSFIYKAEDMIEYARLWNEDKIRNRKIEDNTVKDEAGEIIMNPEQVKAIDKKRKKP